MSKSWQRTLGQGGTPTNLDHETNWTRHSLGTLKRFIFEWCAFCYTKYFIKDESGPEIQKICIWVLDLSQLFKGFQKILTNLLKLFFHLQNCNQLKSSQTQRICVKIKINIDSETPLNIVFSIYVYHIINIINLGFKKQR